MLCVMCGQPIKSKAIEGADYIKTDQYYCIDCAKRSLTRWPEFERNEKLAEEASRYREALISTLQWSINEGYCVRPNDRTCRASSEKCLRCWLKFLVGEKEG